MELSQSHHVELLIELAVSLGIGVLIGLERQLSNRDSRYSLGGVRTFAIIAIFGFVSGYVGGATSHAVAVVGLIALVLLLGIGHVMLMREGRKGITTELAGCITFLLGLMVQQKQVVLAVAVALIISFVMSIKPKVRLVVEQITEEELFAIFKFLLVSVLVLPLLPNTTLDPFNVVNPREVWTVVVLVLSVSFFGYILMKFWGAERGIMFTGFLGGLVSSTVVTWIFSKRSKNDASNGRLYGMATLLAISIMFPRLFLVSHLVNRHVASELVLPFGLFFLVGSGTVYVLRRKWGDQSGKGMEAVALGNPFNLGDAIKFGLIFSTILLIVSLANSRFGQAGVYAASVLSGFASVDAMAVSLARLAHEQLSLNVATNGIIIAASANNLVKAAIAAFQGSRQYALTVAGGIVVLLTVTGAWMLWA